jgi:hypothetical protein
MRNNHHRILTKPNNLEPFNWQEVTREEIEKEKPDPYRFLTPEMYMTEEELKYFWDDKQRKLFVEQFWPKPTNPDNQ